MCVCVLYVRVLMQRLAAQQCVRQMQDPSFPCLRYLLSCDSQAQLFLAHLQGHSVIFWDGDKDDRWPRRSHHSWALFLVTLVLD